MTREELIKELFSYTKEEKDSLMDIIEGIYLIDPRDFIEIDYYDAYSSYREETECFGLKDFTLIFTLLRSHSVSDDHRTVDTLISMYRSGEDIDLDLVALILQIGEEFNTGDYLNKIEEIALVQINSIKDEDSEE